MNSYQLKRAISADLTGRQFKVLTIIIVEVIIGIDKLVLMSGVSRGHMYVDLKELESRGLIKKSLSGKYSFVEVDLYR